MALTIFLTSKQFTKSLSSIFSLRNRLSFHVINGTRSLYINSTDKSILLPNNSNLTNNINFANHHNYAAYFNHIILNNFHSTNLTCDELKTILCPPFAESITEGDIRWSKAVGDNVNEDDIIAEIETDKTAVAVPAPASGIIEALLIPDGEKVSPGQAVCTIKVGAGVTVKQSEPFVEKVPKEESIVTEVKTPESKTSDEIPTKPPPVPKVPTQPMSIKNVEGVKITPLSTESISAPTQRSENRVKMSRMRLRIAQRLKDAQNTCAMLTTFNEIDMSNIMDLRKKYQDAFQKQHKIKLGFMSAFLKASAYALQHQPVVNAVIDNNEIIYRDYVDISVAVATPKGLVVPVVRNCEKMSFAEIEKSLFDLGEKAKNNLLAIEDMDGGTFTVSNGGVFGSMFGTPIINPPQSAILGMHGIFQRPVAIDGKVEIRPMMYIALTYDHRLIDGREAVVFLRKIKEAIEDPRIMFLEL